MKNVILAFCAICPITIGISYAQDLPAFEQKVVEAAKAEGSLTIYTVTPTENEATLIQAFNKLFPSIRVDTVRLAGGQLMTRVQTEAAAGRLTADVVDFSDAQAAVAVENLFTAYVPPNAADYPPQMYSKMFWPRTTTGLCLGYNKAILPAAPTSYKDMLDPANKGRVGVVTALAGGSGWARILFERKMISDDFWKQQAQNAPIVFPSGVPMSDAMVRGEVVMGVFSSNQVIPKGREGAPVACAFTREGIPALQNQAGIPKTAAHPNAAKLYMDFSLSKAAQRIIVEDWGGFSSMKGAPRPEGADPSIPLFFATGEDTDKLKDKWTAEWNSLFERR